MKKTTVIASLAAAGAIFAMGMAHGTAEASTTPIHWLVKGQDMQSWNRDGVVSEGILAAGSVPAAEWTTCGVYKGVQYGFSDDTTCGTGETLVVENYYELVDAYKAFTPKHVLFDLESWSYSGNESQRPEYYIKKTIALAKSHGSQILVTLGGKLANNWTAYAAADSANFVSVQSQGAGTVAAFRAKLLKALAVVPASKLIMGLGTNTPVIHSAAQQRADIALARYHNVSHLWENANNWGTANVCTAADGGPGCPKIAVDVMTNP